MALYAISPRSRQTDFQREVDSIFENLFGGFGISQRKSTDSGFLSPRSDVVENDKAYVLTLELAGVEEKDIDIDLTQGVLTVKAEKREETREDSAQLHRNERLYGTFTRSVTLPENVLSDAITAEFINGILRITVPKQEQKLPESRKILLKNN